MPFQDRKAQRVALIGSNMYVPAMSYSTELIMGQPNPFSLGSPAVGSATAIASAVVGNAAANTVENYQTVWTSDSFYGRALIVTPSGNPGNSCVLEVQGYDYLGQPMSERFTGASGSTSIIYGQKAFYGRIRTKLITPASNAITFGVGTGTRLGLPYKGDVEWAKENGLYVPMYKRVIQLDKPRSAAQAIAGGSFFVRAPVAGYIVNVHGWADSGGAGNNPILTVKIGGTVVTGLTATIVDNTSAYVSGTPTTAGYNANNRVAPGGLIEILGSASASATSDMVGVDFQPTQCLNADLTDPQTSLVGDPRGMYDPTITLDGTKEIIVGLMGDNSVNSSGNGGLLGLKHNTPT